VKLLIDEMWTAEVAVQLRRRGFDAESVQGNTQLESQSDAFLLAYSIEENRVIVTENVDDFRGIAARLREAGQSHPGLVFTTPVLFDRGRSGAIGRIIRALENLIRSEVDLTDQELWLRRADR
jgi:hypothetical protein